eukprot:gene24154-9736_t
MAARICFLTHFLDPTSGVQWVYQLFYYPDTKEVELLDVKNRRHVLKRIRPAEDLKPELLFIGSTVTVYSRQLKIVEYGDEYTKRKFEEQGERTLAMVKPDAVRHLGKIVNAIYQSGFVVCNMRMCKLSRQDAEAFYACHRVKPFFDNLTAFMSSGRVVAMELMAPGAIRKWRELIGPTNSDTARKEAPNSLRAHFGTDGTMNGCAMDLIPDTWPGCGQGHPSCHRKTYIVSDGAAGLAAGIIQDQHVSPPQTVNLDKVRRPEFLEVYQGVGLGEVNGHCVAEISSGPCIAIGVADLEDQTSSGIP